MNKRLLLLLSGDVVLSVAALPIGAVIRFGSFVNIADITDLSGIKIYVFILVLLFSSHLCELFDIEKNAEKKEILVRIGINIVLSFFLLSAIYYLIPGLLIGRGWLAISLACFSLLQFFCHIGYLWCSNIPGLAKRVLVIGTGPLANKIGGLILSTNHNHLLSGYFHCSGETVAVPIHHILNNGKGLIETIRDEKAKKIVISLSERRGVFPAKDLLACKLSGIEVVDAPSFYEEINGKLFIENITPSCMIFSDGFRITHFRRLFKRIFDLIFAVIGMGIVMPLIPVIAIFIKIDSRGPVFFKQIRLGKGDKEFILYKFRTMHEDAESKTGAVWARENDPRITKVGKFLRKSRIDEIPQLFNVLKGEMSFIGPRPERPEMIRKLEEVIPFYSERHTLKPGITGWAQVKHSYGASVEDSLEKLRYDLFYIKHSSLFLDLLIILETIKVVLFGRGGR
jgi:sugar transferase (PEP-CTERM system associated)